MLGIKVLKINKLRSRQFKAGVELAYGTVCVIVSFQFCPAITYRYRSNCIWRFAEWVSANLIKFAIYFATWSRSAARNRARMTNAEYTRILAL